MQIAEEMKPREGEMKPVDKENTAQRLSDNVRGKLMPGVTIRFICALLGLKETPKIVI